MEGGEGENLKEAPGRQINVELVRRCDRPASIPPAAAAAAGRTSAPSPARKRPERRSVLCFFYLACPGAALAWVEGERQAPCNPLPRPTAGQLQQQSPAGGGRVGLRVGRDWGEPLCCVADPQVSLIVSKSVPSSHPKPSFPVLGDLVSVRLQGVLSIWKKVPAGAWWCWLGLAAAGRTRVARCRLSLAGKARGARQGAGREGARPRGLQAPRGEPPGSRAACPLGQAEFIPMPDAS